MIPLSSKPPKPTFPRIPRSCGFLIGDGPHNVAPLYARLGDEARAMPLLERAFEGRVFEMLFLNVAPDWDLLRDRPGFKALVRRIGIPIT